MKKTVRNLIVLFMSVFLLCACKNTSFTETNCFGLDTIIVLKTESGQSAEKIKNLVSEYEKICSPTDEESELYLLNRNKMCKVSEKFEKVFGEALKISEKTDGAYNFSVYPLMMKWGFLSREYTVPGSEEILQILPYTDLSEIKIENGELIKSAGRLSFVAHLHLMKKSDDEVFEFLKKLKKEGLCGIEGYYSEYTPEMQEKYQNMAKELDLLISGGTDFHAEMKPHISIGTGFGNLKIPYSVLEDIKSAL